MAVQVFCLPDIITLANFISYYPRKIDEIALLIINNPALLKKYTKNSSDKETLILLLPQYANQINSFQNESKSISDALIAINSSNATVWDGQCQTMQEHLQWRLYGSQGYYSSGEVKIDTDAQKPHFSTNATKNPTLAYIIAMQGFHAYQNTTQAERRPFHLVELSGGNGQLAFDILSFIKRMATSDLQFSQKWQEFWNNLQYTTFEISPALAEKQRAKNAEFREKYTVRNESAENVSVMGNIGLCFSNELFDMLEWNTFKKNQGGNFLMEITVPVLTNIDSQFYEKFPSLERYPDIGLELNRASFALTKHDVERLGISYKDKTFQNYPLVWRSHYVSVDHFPQVRQFIADNTSYFNQLQRCKLTKQSSEVNYQSLVIEHHISPLLFSIGKALAADNIRINLHLDYATLTKGGTFCEVRCYGEGIVNKAERYHFQTLGVDITTDPDFRLLGQLMTKGRLDHAEGGHQRILSLRLLSDADFKDFLIMLDDAEREKCIHDILDFVYMKDGFRYVTSWQDSRLKPKTFPTSDCFGAYGYSRNDHALSSYDSWEKLCQLQSAKQLATEISKNAAHQKKTHSL